jgi:hypothetical protein
MRRFVALLLFPVILQLYAATQEVGTLTVLEGDLRLIRGEMVMQAVEGMRLRQGDILESSERGFDQLEFGDGTIVALGPSSRLFLLRSVLGHPGNAGAPSAELVLLNGWLKGETSAKSAAFRYVSPLLGAATQDATVNLQAQPTAANLFVESGSVLIGEVNAEANWKKVGVGKSGQFFSRTAGGGVSTGGRPTQGFINSMPQAFRDTLPSRISRFSGKSPQPVRQHEATFSDVLPWLSIGRPWRMSLLRRFTPLASNPAFRAALEAHLKEYPEWDPVLHPKKNPSTAPAISNSDSGSQHK